ncbi:MAG: membrane protein insertase YidC [Treponema sp.]|jgi:YidC/Oxa1 family membrane protein insertase|nr:membrane protein insertase YidC [Treponema sp.]
MEKRTILAVVLSIVVMLGFYFIMALVYPPVPAPSTVSPGLTESTGSPGAGGATGAGGTAGAVSNGGTTVVTGSPAQGAEAGAGPFDGSAAPVSPEILVDPSLTQGIPVEALQERRITIDTELVTAVFTNAGGDLVSWKLKKHTDDAGPLEMLVGGSREARGFTVAFGGMDTPPIGDLFTVERPRGEPYTVIFSQDRMFANGEQFSLIKRYTLLPNEYMFELEVTLRPKGYSAQGFSFPGNPGALAAAYTLGFGPQIGPAFEKLDQRYEYRNYFTYTKNASGSSGKRKQEKVNEANPAILPNTQASWSAIAGKYFTLIAIPLFPQYDLAFSARPEPGLAGASRLFISRPAAASVDDKYRFYLGPKNQADLQLYNSGNNGFLLKDMQIVEVANSKGFLAPLESLLKVLLTFFNRIVHNYGVAIILLTLLVKVLMFPLTKKGSESTLRMQTLAPKIKEIQEKYKDNPQKMNLAMAEFYKKEGYNPLSGCLPMLLQLPLFLAMYNLFNNHFDLRGAMFIPGWIPDLSIPESIFHFENFRMPIVGWTDIRLLPFIYVGSQLLYGKVTQTPDQKGNAQMKIMLYAMPIVFFFVLYDVPAGLLVYWIMSNVLTMVQQLTINKYLAQKRAEMAAAGSAVKTISVVKPEKAVNFSAKGGKRPVAASRKKKK